MPAIKKMKEIYICLILCDYIRSLIQATGLANFKNRLFFFALEFYTQIEYSLTWAAVVLLY